METKKELTIKQAFVLLFIVVIGIGLIFVLNSFSSRFSNKKEANLKSQIAQADTSVDRSSFMSQINPRDGYEIKSKYDNLGPNMIAAGVIDLKKFKDAYESSGQKLEGETLDILTKGSNQNIRITKENSYFLLNYFWALGLANKSKILDEGTMVQDGGRSGAGNFASTGGWTIANGNAMDYYSKLSLIILTDDQEKLVEKVGGNIYRPCCDNPTSFPDCNHGMALLGILELMASKGATENQMYEAGKYFNSYWFPTNYYEIALYLKNKEGKDFKATDGKIILSKEYSSSTGYGRVHQWLLEKELIKDSNNGGANCSV